MSDWDWRVIENTPIRSCTAGLSCLALICSGVAGVTESSSISCSYPRVQDRVRKCEVKVKGRVLTFHSFKTSLIISPACRTASSSSSLGATAAGTSGSSSGRREQLYLCFFQSFFWHSRLCCLYQRGNPTSQKSETNAKEPVLADRAAHDGAIWLLIAHFADGLRFGIGHGHGRCIWATCWCVVLIALGRVDQNGRTES